MICENCGKEFIQIKNEKFCSRSCLAQHNGKSNKASCIEKLKSFYKEKYYKNPKRCPVCNNVIPFEKRRCKTCCNKCARQLAAKNNTYKGGGYRPGSGRSKSGYYNGIYCGSTYELVYLIYNLDHNIPIKRCDKTFEYEYNGKKHIYVPDFIINDETIVETKGRYEEIVKIKAESVNEPYLLLFKKDLKKEFEYVYDKYKVSEKTLYTLYDKYIGKSYEYRCDYCGKMFNSLKPLKDNNEHVHFCSRTCSGKYRKNKNYGIDNNREKISNSLRQYHQKMGHKNYKLMIEKQHENGLRKKKEMENRLEFVKNLNITKDFIKECTKFFNISENNTRRWLKRNCPNHYNEYILKYSKLKMDV